ncbi:hypothetical protein L1049_019986 [Liquidambar formosana]|uniref:EF-hand domain-containing protein n=1 Tax=Liquidambar formosana TaxID=63359 RepID=A0AAP0S7L3_LIQFO
MMMGNSTWRNFARELMKFIRIMWNLKVQEKMYPHPEEIFDKLDVNKDKFLTVEELIPILRYLYPGELSYAKHYSSYLIHEADDNGDGRLTLDEMLNHEYIFYSTVYDDRNEDDDDDFIHDEL